MALKIKKLFSLILWLSLFVLFLHIEWLGFNNTTTTTSSNPKYLMTPHRTTLSNISNRKLASKFDFTPFLKHRRSRHHRHGHETDPGGGGNNEIDPKYGVEKRLVPTGPNPLHH